MITLTDSTVVGAVGSTLADMDAVTVDMARLLGGGEMSAWYAADYLRDVYGAVIRSAGAVTLALPTTRDDVVVVAA